MSSVHWYILAEDGKTPIPLKDGDPRLAEPRNNKDRWVRSVTIKSRRETFFVSTIFLGLDHNHSLAKDAEPILWETMIFRNGESIECWRYSSYERALAGHSKAFRAAQKIMRQTPYRNATRHYKKLPERRRRRAERDKLNELQWRQEYEARQKADWFVGHDAQQTGE